METPIGATLRTYHVGFGDCFLLSFRYDGGLERHVLIDFGSTQTPPGKPDVMMETARDIQARVKDGELTAVVATHRHRDHISGFATSSKRDGTGDLIRACNPKLVIQPWTEDPDLPTDATAPAEHKSFRLALMDLHAVSFNVAREAGAYKDLGLAEQLSFLGENNLANKSAVDNLIGMGKAAQAEYVYAGFATALSKLLPGVTVSVLGPPTLEQTTKIKKQRSKDEAEFWHFWQPTVQAVRLGFAGPEPGSQPKDDPQPAFPHAPRYSPSENPPQMRWFRRKMREMRGTELLELVRILDKVLNNTSVILLFEFAGRKLLFPGDAQIENWSYCLDDSEICEKLKEVDLYKVGHHGSLNATPTSLWKLFTRKRAGENGDDPGVMKTIVSTLAGKHGHPEDGTEVPRTTLVSELAKSSDFYTTQRMEPVSDFFHDIEILPAATLRSGQGAA
nr:hypothetical protein [uncultured bacterium]